MLGTEIGWMRVRWSVWVVCSGGVWGVVVDEFRCGSAVVVFFFFY